MTRTVRPRLWQSCPGKALFSVTFCCIDTTEFAIRVNPFNLATANNTSLPGHCRPISQYVSNKRLNSRTQQRTKQGKTPVKKTPKTVHCVLKFIV
jgi:hypothetical protein